MEKSKGYLVAFDLGGKELSSEEIAALIDKKATEGISEMTFIIGGSEGLSDEVKKAVDLSLSFGRVTYPHQLMRVIAAEPLSCPKLTKGKFEYDFGDEAGLTPLLPMYTLGHTFKPASIHAGGLRYHGAGVILSQLMKDGFMEAVDISQTESFKAGVLFARTEGIIPAPESCHAIAATVREALKCKESGEAKTILFNLSGHGFVDMAAYDQYISGNLGDISLSEDELAKYISSADSLNR